MELKRRSLVKTITWRVVAVFITMGSVYIYNQDLKESIVVSFMANGIKMFLYYLHERMWTKIKYGIKRPDFEI
ncbi:MAG: DUF2061 domain-containing protein [Spirochaetia bacterium]|nr:DUF2061 domain-containing protein [Spirochaetia bacterium]